jgi:hypothetical protein
MAVAAAASFVLAHQPTAGHETESSAMPKPSSTDLDGWTRRQALRRKGTFDRPDSQVSHKTHVMTRKKGGKNHDVGTSNFDYIYSMQKKAVERVVIYNNFMDSCTNVTRGGKMPRN